MAAVDPRRASGEASATRSLTRRLAALPATDLATLLGNRRRIVVVAPHPDDEVLGCGGLIALASRRGVDVLIVSVSDGEACYPGHPAWTPQRLREARGQELRDALAELGANDAQTLRLHIADGGIESATAKVTAMLAATLRPSDLVLTTAAQDGHPDHEATHRGVAAARHAIGFRLVEFPIWGWSWSESAGHRSRAVRLPLDPAMRRAKRAAIRCFRTQIGDCTPPIADPVLPADVLARFHRPREVFFL